MNEYGLSFSPGSNDQQRQRPEGQSPIQDAIKTVSLRIPRFAGSGPVGAGAPNALLQGAGGGGLAGQVGPGAMGGQGGQQMNLMQFLQALFGMQQGQSGQGGQENQFSLSPGTATPNVNFGMNPEGAGAQEMPGNIGPQGPQIGGTGLPEFGGQVGGGGGWSEQGGVGYGSAHQGPWTDFMGGNKPQRGPSMGGIKAPGGPVAVRR